MTEGQIIAVKTINGFVYVGELLNLNSAHVRLKQYTAVHVIPWTIIEGVKVV